MRLGSVLEFSKMLNAFRRVERVVHVPGTDRLENDSEHSYNLAMLAWHIVNAEKLPLDADKVLKYALAHDIVEVYAGDTYIYTEDKDHLASKESREREALEKLRKEFPLDEEMFSFVEEYMKREDAESRFVYALDKVQPVIQIYLDHGRMWREKHITWEMLHEHKKDRVALSPEIQPYFDEIMQLLKANEKELFD